MQLNSQVFRQFLVAPLNSIAHDYACLFRFKIASSVAAEIASLGRPINAHTLCLIGGVGAQLYVSLLELWLA